MKALSKVFATALVSLVLTACGGVPVRERVAGSVPAVSIPAVSTCPPAFDKDAIMKYGYPEAWNREFREPPTVYPIFKCARMQPMIEWAKSASNYESERGGCTGSHTSFTCSSSRGPSGTSRRGSQWHFEGDGYVLLALAVKTKPDCADAPSVRRSLHTSINSDGTWVFRAESECYK